MKSIRQFALSAFLTLGAFSAMTLTSCNPDECKDVTCQNGGTCSDGNCACLGGFEGDNCETLSATKYIGTWNVNEPSCGGNYTNTVSQGTTNTTILLSNLGNFSNPAAVIATVDRSTISINNFTDATGRKFSGSGTYTMGTTGSFTITYTVTYTDNTTETCTASYSK